MLQGRPKVNKGAKSATMLYAFSFALCNRAVTVTMDLSASGLELFSTDHWLSNPSNTLPLELTDRAFVDTVQASSADSAALASTPPRARRSKRRMSGFPRVLPPLLR